MDMTPETQVDGTTTYRANPGGAPCNVAVMAAKMGSKAKVFSKVGNDLFGKTLKKTLEKEGVDVSFLKEDALRPTTLAFVHLEDNGERHFSFYRTETADVSLTQSEMDNQALVGGKILAFGSVAFSKSPLRETLLSVMALYKEHGKLLAYDPNYRPLLWDSEAEAKYWMTEGLKSAHVLKVSEEEALFLSGEKTLEEAILWFYTFGIELVTITLGAEGALVGVHPKRGLGEKPRHFKGMNVSGVKDTTGAGDAFFGTLIHGLLCFGGVCATENGFSLEGLSWLVIEKCVSVANVAAALCVTGYGAIPSLPTFEAVMAMWEKGIL